MYNILICDDEQDIVNALKIYLSGGDYCLFEAHNGREALEAVEKNDIHLILMDIMMPQEAESCSEAPSKNLRTNALFRLCSALSSIA